MIENQHVTIHSTKDWIMSMTVLPSATELEALPLTETSLPAADASQVSDTTSQVAADCLEKNLNDLKKSLVEEGALSPSDSLLVDRVSQEISEAEEVLEEEEQEKGFPLALLLDLLFRSDATLFENEESLSPLSDSQEAARAEEILLEVPPTVEASSPVDEEASTQGEEL